MAAASATYVKPKLASPALVPKTNNGVAHEVFSYTSPSQIYSWFLPTIYSLSHAEHSTAFDIADVETMYWIKDG